MVDLSASVRHRPHMSYSYTKLFSSLITSSVWGEDVETKVVWITLLALADQHGEVQAAVPGVARLAGIELEATRRALGVLEAPDPDSRTPDEEGRRIIPIEGGWRLVNHAKYRALASKEQRREQDRIRKAETRARERVSASVRNLSAPCPQKSAQAEADTEAEADFTPSGASAPSSPSGGASSGKKPRKSPRLKPTEAETRKAVESFLALQALPGFVEAVLEWREALGAKKRWASVAALRSRLTWLEKRVPQALELVRIATEERWTDPVHAEKRLQERTGQQPNTPRYVR